MSALYAAGYQADGSADAGPDFAALQQRLRALKGPAVDELNSYYHDHVLGSGGETASRFISFSLLISPPPKFFFQEDEATLPADVLSISDFAKVLAAFYQEAHLDREWQRMAGAYDAQVDRYRGPVYHSTLTASSYLRELNKSSSASSFTVYVEPLAGTRANFRTSTYHYSMVVGSARELPIDEIRHAYLHFLIDPLVVRYGDDVDSKRDLMNIADRAPQLPREYNGDFTGLFDECMVKAVELRLTKMSAAELAAAENQNDQAGLILVHPIVDQLKLFEKDQPAMKYYFPDLVKAISVDAEMARLKDLKFAPAAPPQSAEAAAQQSESAQHAAPLGKAGKPGASSTAQSSENSDSAPAAPLSDLDRDLLSAQNQIAAGNFDAARGMFEAILATHPHEPRAEFELAMVALKQQDPDRAQLLLRRIVRHSATGDGIQPDPPTLAWSHVYLGRIYDLQENRDDAMAEYSAALKVQGAPEQARKAAEAGQKAPYGGSSSGADSSSNSGSAASNDHNE